MSKLIKHAVALVSLFLSCNCFSQETGWISVLQVGGQVTNIHFVISQTIVNSGCSGSVVIVPNGTFDAESTKRFYAMLLTATATGKQVRLAASGCYDATHPAMISTDYWFIQS